MLRKYHGVLAWQQGKKVNDCLVEVSRSKCLSTTPPTTFLSFQCMAQRSSAKSRNIVAESCALALSSASGSAVNASLEANQTIAPGQGLGPVILCLECACVDHHKGLPLLSPLVTRSSPIFVSPTVFSKMHFTLSLLALAGAATAQIRGFNYGALYADNRARMLSDWEADFRAAQELPGVGAFTSARLFTMVQGYSQSDIISALPAAVATNTSLLLGLWCSGGDAAFQNEITALRAAVQQYGEQLQGKILGISIGSEDLYRISPTGIENESGPGAGPQQLVNYVSQAREAIQGTAWADVVSNNPIDMTSDHTDTLPANRPRRYLDCVRQRLQQPTHRSSRFPGRRRIPILRDRQREQHRER